MLLTFQKHDIWDVTNLARSKELFNLLIVSPSVCPSVLRPSVLPSRTNFCPFQVGFCTKCSISLYWIGYCTGNTFCVSGGHIFKICPRDYLTNLWEKGWIMWCNSASYNWKVRCLLTSRQWNLLNSKRKARKLGKVNVKVQQLHFSFCYWYFSLATWLLLYFSKFCYSRLLAIRMATKLAISVPMN